MQRNPFESSPAVRTSSITSAVSGPHRVDKTTLRPSSTLWLGIHFPTLPLAVFISQTDLLLGEPTIVCDKNDAQARVLCSNRAAQQQGINPDIPLRVAYTLTTKLAVFYRDAAAERAALRRLAAWAAQFTSKVAIAAQQTLLLEIAGSLRLFKGLDPLLTSVNEELLTLGYEHQIALSPTPFSAELLARTRPGTRVLTSARLNSEVGILPIDVLDLDRHQAQRLRGMGLHCLHDLFRLPREGLARRTTPALIRTLDRLLGRHPDPQHLYTPPHTYRGQLTLNEPIDNSNALLLAGHRLLAELTGALRAQLGGVDALTWTLHHHTLAPTVVTLSLLRPTRDRRYLLSLLRERFERLTLHAPVEAITLTTTTFQPLVGDTIDAFTDSVLEQRNQQNALLERLQARLGARAVSGVCLNDEHRPEKAWQHCAPGHTGPSVAFSTRPFWLLSTPRPLSSRHGVPYFHGRLALKNEYERIATGWWDHHSVNRDYFFAVTPTGAQLWIFRELTARHQWYLHGFF